MKKLYSKILLQLTAVYSSNKENEKANECSKKAINNLNSCFQDIAILLQIDFIKDQIRKEELMKYKSLFQEMSN